MDSWLSVVTDYIDNEDSKTHNLNGFKDKGNEMTWIQYRDSQKTFIFPYPDLCSPTKQVMSVLVLLYTTF